MTTNEGRVYFALDASDFDPDELTQFLGIEPTSIKRKGERIPNLVPKNYSWILSTENVVNNYIDVSKMATSIIDQLKPKKQLILDAITKYKLYPRFEVVLWISINQEHSTPAIGFEIETVKFLGEIGAFIDIDTYKHKS